MEKLKKIKSLTENFYKIDLNTNKKVQSANFEEEINNDSLNNTATNNSIPENCIKRVLYFRKLFKDEKLMKHFESISEEDLSDYKSVAKYLGSFSETELEQYALIFLWIVKNISYDTKSFFSGKVSDCSPQGVFKSKTAVCSGYARLFTAMCKEIGLPAENISGYAKGYSYKPSQKIVGTNHEWNAIKLNNNYYLVDSCWGAGFLNESKNFVWKFTPYYFLASPILIINSHRPTEDKWQLLKKPLSQKDFESQSKIDYEGFYTSIFKEVFEPITHESPIIKVVSNSINIKIKVPNKNLLISLERNKKKMTEMTLLTYDSESEIWNIDVLIPESGDYELCIFSRDINSEQDNFLSILKFYIMATCKNKLKHSGYPKSYNSLNNTLYSPLTSELKKDTSVLFKAKLRGAEQVAIVQNNDWQYLKDKGHDIWEGTIKIISDEVNLFKKRNRETNFTLCFEFKGIK